MADGLDSDGQGRPRRTTPRGLTHPPVPRGPGRSITWRTPDSRPEQPCPDPDHDLAAPSHAASELTRWIEAKTIGAALDSSAGAAGVTRSELLETTVPTLGLGPDGTLVETIGDYRATVTVGDDVTLAFATSNGKPLKSAPAAVKEHVAPLRALVKTAKSTLAAERTRIEDLLSVERVWDDVDRWRSLYLDHPLTGSIGRRLLWQAQQGPRWVSVRVEDGRLLTLAGKEVSDSALDGVRLWHPLLVDPEEVAAWRAWFTEHEIRQPFKQAFREVYMLTPAEERTQSYSNRFAAHILRYRQAGALMRTRGWSGQHLGFWDGGYEGHVSKELGDGQWQATFFLALVDNVDQSYVAELASTDQVRFARRAGRVWEQVDLVDVPPLVLSEAMRDVDLFVGVTSVAGDPTWIDSGPERFHQYWRETAFGGLTSSGEMRKDALARLLPKLNVASQVKLKGNFVVVRGKRAIYKVHVGSGNILMEPNDRYLCIVTDRGASNPGLFLPFEEDGGMLSVIVSKVLLLAHDEAITDSTILRQIA